MYKRQGLSGVELARAVLEQAGEVVPMQKPSYAYDRSPEYWTGSVSYTHLSAGIELFVFTFLAIHSYCRHQVA